MTSPTVAYCTVSIRRANNPTKEQIIAAYVHNLYTNAGRDLAHQEQYTNTVAGTRGAGFIGLSTNSATPVAGDTTLTGEITTGGLARADAGSGGTLTHVNGTNTSTVAFTFTATATHTNVQKAALFNASSGGTMPHIATFTAVTVNNLDQITVTFTITKG